MEATKPIILDETGKAMVEQLKRIADNQASENFVIGNYLYLGSARVLGETLYLSNAEFNEETETITIK